MRKRNLLSLIILILSFFGFMLFLFAKASEVGITLRATHPYVEYAFYSLAGIGALFFIVRPFFIVLLSPSFTLYHLKSNIGEPNRKIMKDNYDKLKKISAKLIRERLIKEESIVLLNSELNSDNKDFTERYQSLKREVNHVIAVDIKKDIRRIIMSTARDTMYLTALSQNSFIDTFVVVVNNFRMVKKIIQRCGYRPSFFRLLKLYVNVIFSSLVAEGAQNVDLGSLLGNSIKGIAKPILGSVVDGALNSFFMLRTGFLTKNYIFNEVSDSNEFNIINSAMIEAAAALPELAIHSVIKPIIDILMGTIVTPTKGIVRKVFSGKSMYPELEEINE